MVLVVHTISYICDSMSKRYRKGIVSSTYISFIGVRLCFVLFSCMAVNNVVSVQYNGGLLPDIVLLTWCYDHRGTRLNAMKTHP